MFDAPGKGQFPIFRGGFTCEVLRPFGIDTEWQVTTNIRLDEAAGQLVAFPYPMSGVTGELTVTEDSREDRQRDDEEERRDAGRSTDR